MVSRKGIPRHAEAEDEPGEDVRSWAGRIGKLSVSIAIGAAFAGYLLVQEGIVAVAFVVVGVAAMLAVQRVRRGARLTINREVQGGPAIALSPAPAGAPPVAAISERVAHEPAGGPLPITVEVVEVTSMPAVSAESRARFGAIRARGARLRRLYRRAVLLLALASTALTFVAFRISPDVSLFPILTPFLLAITLAVLAYDAARWGKVERRWDSGEEARAQGVPGRVLGALRTAMEALTSRVEVDVTGGLRSLVSTLRRVRGGAVAERARWEAEVVPLRPVLVPLLGAAWLALSAVETVVYIDASGIVFVVPTVLYLVALQRSKDELERRYPIHASLNLLTLRVFSSPSLRDFTLMTDRWRWLGPMQRLDGSDTAGSSMRDVVAYLRGRVEDVIVEDEDELTEALAAFGNAPDGQLRYPLNSIQCNDVTWKQALQALLDEADAVVMDLSGFNEERRGCAYEIGKLIEQIPFRRFILLVNEDTDMTYLRRALYAARLSTPNSSPNAATDDPVHVLKIPAADAFLPDETYSTWTDRIKARVDAERLVGALLDAASTSRTAPAARIHRWACPGLPRFCSFL